MLECLAKPSKRCVHKLRTSTRRVQAQLELLAMLPEVPAHTKEKQKVLRLLKKLRKAAGEVRDLDVQQDLVAEAAPNKRGSQSHDGLRKEARQLRQELKQKRDQHADQLVQLLKQEKTDLPLAFKELMDSLEDANSLTLTESDLSSLVHTWYSQHSPAAPPALDDIDHLHEIRKSAKLARYLAETAPASAGNVRRLAAKFEDVQEAGGQWHDWLLLSETARAELGNSAELPDRFAARAQKCLSSFERRIEKMSARNNSPHATAA